MQSNISLISKSSFTQVLQLFNIVTKIIKIHFHFKSSSLQEIIFISKNSQLFLYQSQAGIHYWSRIWFEFKSVRKLNLLTCPTGWIYPLSNFRGGISVVTESGQETKSHLVIQNARETDEGNYTCKPSIFKSASVKLYVLDGKICKNY